MDTLMDRALSFTETLFDYGVVALKAIAVWLAISPEAVVVGTAILVGVTVAVKMKVWE